MHHDGGGPHITTVTRTTERIHRFIPPTTTTWSSAEKREACTVTPDRLYVFHARYPLMRSLRIPKRPTAQRRSGRTRLEDKLRVHIQSHKIPNGREVKGRSQLYHNGDLRQGRAQKSEQIAEQRGALGNPNRRLACEAAGFMSRTDGSRLAPDRGNHSREENHFTFK